MFEDLKGKTAVVFGVANKRSIAWAIAQGLHDGGRKSCYHLPERAHGDGSERSDPIAAGRGSIHVRCIKGR